MNCKERLTIQYDGAFVPKELCTIDRNGDADDCDGCEEVCDNIYDDCEGCPIQKCFDRLGELEDKLENGTLVELPCKVGSDVYVSPNNGKNFYIGTLYGKKENGSYLVFVHHKVGALIPYPLENNAFYDWFFKIYSKEEAEARLKKLQDEVK